MADRACKSEGVVRAPLGEEHLVRIRPPIATRHRTAAVATESTPRVARGVRVRDAALRMRRRLRTPLRRGVCGAAVRCGGAVARRPIVRALSWLGARRGALSPPRRTVGVWWERRKCG